MTQYRRTIWTGTPTGRHGPSRTRTSVSVRVCPCASVRTCARAFTLLELLVAMSLMVVVASCLYSALYTGFRAYRSSLLAVEPTSAAINAIELLKLDICGVLPPGSGLAGAFVGSDERGLKGVEADALEFYTTHIYADEETVTGGLGKIELLLEEDQENSPVNYATYQLIRRITTNLLAPRDVTPEEQVLCRNVLSLNLRYFDGEDWVDDWDSTADANSLPLAVEIDIQIAHNNGKNRKNVRKSNEEPEKRRLIQSFAVPCQSAEETEETTSQTSSGGTGSSGSSSTGTSETSAAR